MEMPKYHAITLRHLMLLFVILLAAMLFRRFDAFSFPQLYGEDGPIFFQQCEELGWRSLLTPYNGYLHLLPRLVALLFGLLRVKYEYIPYCYNYSAFAIAYLTAIYLYLCAAQLNVHHKLFFSSVIFLLPMQAEVFMTITNLIWFTPLFLIAYLLAGHKLGNPYLSLPVVCIASLSGPGALLLAPLAIYLILTKRKNASLPFIIALLTIVVCGGIQFWMLKTGGGIARTFPAATEHLHLLKLATNNCSRIFFLDKLPAALNSPIKQMIGGASLFMIFIYIFIVKYKKIAAQEKIVLLYAAIVFLISFTAAYWPKESMVTSFVGARYYFIPFSCIAFIFIWSIDKHIKIYHVVFYVIFWALHGDDLAQHYTDKHWGKQVKEYRLGKRHSMDILPDGWSFNLK